MIDAYIENMKNTNQVITDDPRKRLQKYQINVMKEKRGYPLDYIVGIPPIHQMKYYEERGMHADNFAKFCKAKNAVMRRIVEIRQMKAKPKLPALLLELRDPRLKNDKFTDEEKEMIKQEKRDRLRTKIMALYSDSGEGQMNENDKINKQLKLIKRKYDAQWEVLESIEKQV